MRRKIDTLLARWAESNNPRPLLLRGARRVGKTYTMTNLGRQKFDKAGYVICDFQTNLEQLERVFNDTSNVDRIMSDLSLLLRHDIRAGQTLVILDEIQLSEKALNCLRFFAESSYRVIATGSQLGVTLRNRELPYPSGVDHVTMHPMDFEEYLWAMGEERMAEEIRSTYLEKREFLLHEEALALYRLYIVMGGMPAVVADFVENRNYQVVRSLQAEIDRVYTADVALYAPADAVVRILAVWNSLPRQLARESTAKFKYSEVSKGGRERTYRTPLAWLEAADLVKLNYQTNETAAPLVARDDGSFYKVYLLDTGLMFSKLNLDADTFLVENLRNSLSPRFRGALAENYVMQALAANELEPFYWTPGTSAQSEVEFVIQNRRGVIIPIEVKSGDNVRSISLRHYQQKTGAPYAIRLSTKNFGYENGIFSVPLYAAFCLDEQSLV